jgi:maleylacetoacetate isomerase
MATAHEVILYHTPRSSASYRARIALNLKQIAWTSVRVDLLKDEQFTPEHLARHPTGRVPVLAIGGRMIGQSSAIIEYLDETRANPPLLWGDPGERSLIRDIASQIASDIHPLNNLSVLRRLRTQFGADEAAVAEWSAHWILRGFSALEPMLPDTGGFCVGGAVSMADLMLAPQVEKARAANLDLSPFSNIVRIDAALREIEAFREAAPDRFL